MYLRVYLFFAIIAVTFVQICFFILSGEEIYPGITYPAFARQYRVFSVPPPLSNTPCFPTEIVQTVPDYCLRGSANPRYNNLRMELNLVYPDETEKNIAPKDLFSYINFDTEIRHFQKRMLVLGYWYANDQWPNEKYLLNEYKLQNFLKKAAKKFPQKNGEGKSVFAKKLNVSFFQGKNTILTYALPIE